MRGTVDGSKYQILFDSVTESTIPEKGHYAVRKIRAGKMVTMKVYPIFQDYGIRREADRRMQEIRKTPAAMERINARNREEKFLNLAEENFDGRDIYWTGTYRWGSIDPATVNWDDLEKEMESRHLPGSMEDTLRDMSNFVRKLRRMVKRRGGDTESMKYMWVIERGREAPDTDPHPLPTHYHVHMLLSADAIRDRRITRDDIEGIWPWGLTNAAAIQEEENGLKRLAKYMNKERRSDIHSRRWGRSRNLRKPKETVAYKKMSNRRAEALARGLDQDAREIVQRMLPGHKLVELDTRYGQVIPGAYITIRARRI